MSATELKLKVMTQAQVDEALTEAKKEAFFAGLTGALASSVIGSRLLKFNRNTSIISGILSGVLSGYYFNEAFRSTAIAQLRREDARLAVEAEMAAQAQGQAQSQDPTASFSS
ncbi:hypothetical protein CC2G_001562 [Coprinopsis cinerea AmutBmut pab1-1]|nr:hypothetical protein CC2G_001562 [Coprinopsis cinerea AmutBmut pab1-1]